MASITIKVPDGVTFADLRLMRSPEGDVCFDWAPIAAICAASGIDVALFVDAPEDHAAELIVAWYTEHRRIGGERDPTAEDLIGEVIAEDAADSLSHKPGRA